MFWFIVFIGILSVLFPFVLKGFLFIVLLPLLMIVGFIAFGIGVMLTVKLLIWVLGFPFRLF